MRCDFLHPRRVGSCGTLMWISASAPIAPAVAPGQRDRPQPARARGLAAPSSTFGDSPLVEIAERHVARPPERFDLPREHPVEPVVVGDGSSACSCRSSARSPPAPRARAGTGRPAPPRDAARRRRCRRCRTPAPCRPLARRREDRRGRLGDRLQVLVAQPLVQRDARASSTALTAATRLGHRRHQSRCPRSRAASMFATNSSCVTCSGS